MSEHSQCPRCDKQVSLPAGANPQSRVRCPLCEAEYLLAEALALAPPMLILVDAPLPQVAAVGAAHAGDFAPWGDEEDTALEIESADAVSAPTAPRRSPVAPEHELSETIDAEDFSQALAGPDFEGPSLAGAGDEDSALFGADPDATISGDEFGIELDENEFAPASDETEGADEPGNELVPSSDPFEFGSGPVKAGSGVVLDGKRTAAKGEVPSMAPLSKRRRKKPSTIRQLISIVGGGVFGLSIGYFILLWVAKQDVLGLAPKLPGFMVPQKFRPGGITKAKAQDDTEPAFVKKMKEKNQFDFGDSGPGDLPTNVKGGGFDPAKTPPANPNGGNASPPGGDPANPAGITGGDDTPAVPNLDTPSLDDPLDPLKIGAPKIDEPKLPPGGNDAGTETDPTEPAPTDPTATPAGDDPPSDDAPVPADTAAEGGKPVDPPNTNPPVGGDTPQGDGFLVQGRTEFTPDQLKEALDAAKANQDALLQGSLDNPQFKKTKVAAFLKFCKLGDVYTFTKLKSGDRKSEMLKDSVKGLILNIIDTRLSIPDIEKISDQWLKRPSRPDNGIIIVGTVLKIEKSGKVYATTIRCGATPEAVVLTEHQPFWKAPESIIALGTIVEDPAANLIGYEGRAPIAVFSSLVQPCH